MESIISGLRFKLFILAHIVAIAVSFVEHPLIKPMTLQVREYQKNLAKICVERNTLVVLPTGLGKTVIALLTIVEILKNNPSGKCLLLAPTRPLVYQHREFIAAHLAEGDVSVVTGIEEPLSRREAWRGNIICATPHATLADLRRGHLELGDFTLIIFDEAHRAVGNYPYRKIGDMVASNGLRSRMIGLTASPPPQREKVKQIADALSLVSVEFRSEEDSDVKPYVHGAEVEKIEVDLPPIMQGFRDLLQQVLDVYITVLRSNKLVLGGTVTLARLLELRERAASIRDGRCRAALYSAIRVLHAMNLLETQGLSSLVAFLERYAEKRGAGLTRLFSDRRVREVYEGARGAVTLGVEHPKLEKLKEILRSISKDDRVMIFTSYRDSVEILQNALSAEGIRVDRLVGKSGEGGLTQELQVEALRRLKSGEIQCLVATQVGEEGLDVAECSIVIFYDNVPSAIRFTQRKGRTGRAAPGRVILLLTKGTRDEVYQRIAASRIKSSGRFLKRLVSKRSTGGLDSFI